MRLPVMPPVKPMLAKSVSSIPGDMLYEPKFDGFRCILFRDGDEVELASRNERSLTRYFPELVSGATGNLPHKCVLDGEIVIAHDGKLDFEALQQRIHPAVSRINLLAQTTPASFVAFDLLAIGEASCMEIPFAERREALSEALADVSPPYFVSPSTYSIELARRWFQEFEGAGLDGVIAKPPGVRYAPNQRLMFKIKHERTTDCVVAGFRWHKSGHVVGSLLLGLYEGTQLRPVGVAASFSMARRKELLAKLGPFRLKPDQPHPWAPEGSFQNLPGGNPSRWNSRKDMSWEPLRPELVAEVSYDHMEGDRFRHVTHFQRWRTDRSPESCTFSQLDRPVWFDLSEILI